MMKKKKKRQMRVLEASSQIQEMFSGALNQSLHLVFFLSGRRDPSEAEAELRYDKEAVGGRGSDSRRKPGETKDSGASGAAEPGSDSGEETAHRPHRPERQRRQEAAGRHRQGETPHTQFPHRSHLCSFSFVFSLCGDPGWEGSAFGWNVSQTGARAEERLIDIIPDRGTQTGQNRTGDGGTSQGEILSSFVLNCDPDWLLLYVFVTLTFQNKWTITLLVFHILI